MYCVVYVTVVLYIYIFVCLCHGINLRRAGRVYVIPLVRGAAFYTHTYIHTYLVQGSPSGCGWLEIPGVSQVEEGERHRQRSLCTLGTAVYLVYFCAVWQTFDDVLYDDLVISWKSCNN